MEQAAVYEEKRSSLSRQIIQYALPICVTNLLSMSVVFFVTMMLAQLGKTELAALAIANTCYLTISAFLNTCLYSTSILVGQHHVNGNKPVVASIAWNSIWLSIILGAIGTVILWDADKFLLLVGQSQELVANTVIYFHYAALTMIPLLLGSAISQVYNGMGKPVISTIIIALRLPITIYISYELILGHYHWGLAGASCALLISQVIMLLVTLVYMRYSEIWGYFTIKSKRWDWGQIKQIFNLGVHIGLQFLGELSAISAATFLMGYLGDVALASSQIVSQYTMLLIMIILGVSQAVAIRVSEACGLERYHLITTYTRTAFWIIFWVILLFALLYAIMPLPLMSLFIDVQNPNNVSLIHLTQWLMFLTLPMLVVDGIKNVLTSSLRGLKNSKMPMLIGTLSLWIVGLPVSYLIGIYYSGGPIGLRIGFSMGFVIAAVILWFYFQYYKKQFVSKNAK